MLIADNIYHIRYWILAQHDISDQTMSGGP